LSLMVELQSHIALALNPTFIDVALSASLTWRASSSSPSSAATATGVCGSGPDLSAGTALPLTVASHPTASADTAASTNTATRWRTAASPTPARTQGHIVRQA
jgi:hypothetical protein